MSSYTATEINNTADRTVKFEEKTDTWSELGKDALFFKDPTLIGLTYRIALPQRFQILYFSD